MSVRRLALGLLLAALAAPARAAAPTPAGPRLALTFDDGPRLVETPRLSPQARNQALLDALAAAKVKAALFVTLGNGADRPEGLALLRAWGAAGHAVGNHTVTHPDLNAAGTTLAAYQAEVLTCDAVIRGVPGFRPWFRYTFLREGNTPEKRDGMRAFLKDHGYRNAYVSIDTSDWRLDQALTEKLAKDPTADLAPLRQAYLDHLSQRAKAYRAMGSKLLGREMDHVLLLHHNLLNALWLGDAIARLRAEGWTIVSPDEAFADPAYDLVPERPAPGQSLLVSLARSKGWPRTPELERLLDDADFEVEALRTLGY